MRRESKEGGSIEASPIFTYITSVGHIYSNIVHIQSFHAINLHLHGYTALLPFKFHTYPDQSVFFTCLLR